MNINKNLEAVITSYNQKSMIYEAVHSLCGQTILPKRIIIVDDGSTDETSMEVLEKIETDRRLPVPILIIRQPNSGVSAARNTGIREAKAPLILVLDGDDGLAPSFIEETGKNADRMQQALTDREVDGIAAMAHKLLPLFTLIGASESVASLRWLESCRGEEFSEEIEKTTLETLEAVRKVVRAAEEYSFGLH